MIIIFPIIVYIAVNTAIIKCIDSKTNKLYTLLLT